MPQILPLLLVLAALGLAAPATASADAEITLNGNQLVFTSDINTAANLVISRENSALECGAAVRPSIQFGESQTIRDQVPGPGCGAVISNVAACDPAIFTSIRLNLRDGDDEVFVGDDVISLAAGDDTVIGGTGSDVAELDSGDDTVRLDDVANDGRTGETKNLRTDLEVVDVRRCGSAAAAAAARSARARASSSAAAAG